MVHTVGLLGVNGRIGSATAHHLAASAAAGKINLVLLHRAGSPPKGLSAAEHVEFRTIDIDGPAAALDKAVEGINVFISAVAFGALPSEPNVVDALARSPDLVTFIPSVYSTTWTKEDRADQALGPVISFLHGGLDRAVEQKIGLTTVYVGAYEDYFFEYAFIGSSIKQNLVWANQAQLQNGIPITAIEHLGKALNDIATSDPQSIKDTEHSVVTFWPTGQEVADLYLKINGKPAEIKDYTAADREAFRADVANFGPAKAGYFDKWESAQWDYETGGKVSHKDYQGPGIEELARRFA